MQIGDTVVVGTSAATVVTRDAIDTKMSSVIIAFDDEESEDDAKVKESKKPKRETIESVDAVSDRRAKVGRGTETNTKHKLKIEQDQLLIQQNRIAERTGQLKGESKKTHKTKALDASETFVSYKNSEAVPRSADANKIHADLDNSSVIFPVLGTSLIVHASNIKGATKDKTANVVRAQFSLPTNIPGTTAFIKELSYRFLDAASATASLKKITDVKRKFTLQIQEKKDLESLTEQAAVRILRGSVRPHALRGIRYWPTIGRKVKQKGDLELHENGLKFICQATRTEFEFVFSNVQYAFFQKAGRSYKEVTAALSLRGLTFGVASLCSFLHGLPGASALSLET
jgi:nucleosome binding factor SPN SPT16 subunit